jgi:sensor histidine kinase YesM
VCWVLYALFYTFFIARQEPSAPLFGLFLGQLFYSLVLGLYSIPVWWITVRAMDRRHWGWTLAVHLLLGPLYAWLGLESYLAVFRLWIGPTAIAEVEANYQWIVFGNLTIYAVQFAVYHLVRSVQRLRWREQQAAEYAAMARERELAALKAQVHPHFLFNTLNSISATVHADPEEARDMITDLAHLLRYALDSTGENTVPLRQEIDFARAYLDLEAHRFSDRLTVKYDIGPNPADLDTPVPPMVLQPLVENAIKHGIGPSADGGTVALRVGRDDGVLRVSVADTGVGPDGDVTVTNGASDTNGVGLANTNQRLIHAFGPNAHLHTESRSPHGFRVWFEIPADASEYEHDDVGIN